jgi:hypothetical protein
MARSVSPALEHMDGRFLLIWSIIMVHNSGPIVGPKVGYADFGE